MRASRPHPQVGVTADSWEGRRPHRLEKLDADGDVGAPRVPSSDVTKRHFSELHLSVFHAGLISISGSLAAWMSMFMPGAIGTVKFGPSR